MNSNANTNPSSTPLSIGIIGAGTRSLHVYREIAAAAGDTTRLAAFVDPDPARADAVRALPGAENAVAVATPEALIGYPGLNAVMIGSPNALHAEPAIRGMQAGCAEDNRIENKNDT